DTRFSRVADPRPRFDAPTRHTARARHAVRTRRLARPIAPRLMRRLSNGNALVGGGDGYREAQLVVRNRSPRPLVHTGYQVPGATFYLNSGITFDTPTPTALPKIFFERVDRWESP